MTSNRTNMKFQKGKVRSTAGASPARSEENSNMPDLSIIRKSIVTSVTGFAQACNVYHTGTPELKQLLTMECDIIYECRVCRNLFRSLANFISHKRVYCCEKFNSSLHPHFSNNNYMKDDVGVIMKNEEDYQEFVRNKATIVNKQKVDCMKKSQKDLTSVIEKLMHKSENGDKSESELTINRVKMQSIPESNTAVYQSVISSNRLSHDSIREQVAELDRMISSNEGILGLDGKLLTCHSSTKPETFYSSVTNNSNGTSDSKNSNDELFCKTCKISFSTLKTKKFHIKHKHTNNRLVYPCTDCADTFSNSWSVFRHLFKVHRKSATHIRKLRETIQKKAYMLDTSTINPEKVKTVAATTEPLSEQQRMDQENQAWIDNLEGDGDIPRCGGCGKRFERRAALCSHRQTCQLRKSAQNKINSNSQKRFAGKTTFNHKDIDDYPEPVVKLAKIDKLAEKLIGERPIEKKIEIKIRKDYNKSNPASVRTNSPLVVDEDATPETMDQDDLTNSDGKLGENDYDVISTIDICNEYNQDDSNFTLTVKDCDDAIVDFEKNSSDNSNDDMTYADEGDLNFEDIQRISRIDRSPNKACGQIDDSSLSKDDYSMASNNYELLVGNNCDLDMIDEKKKSTDNSFEDDDRTDAKYHCAYCKSTFSVKQKLERHISRHLIWIKFECKLCGVKSCNVAQYQRHMKTQHQMLQPTRLMKMASKMNPGNVEAERDSEIFADTMDNDFLDEGFDRLKDDAPVESVNAKRCKPKNTYRPIKRKKHFIKRGQKAIRKKSTLLSDALRMTKTDSSSITEFEPRLEENAEVISSIDWEDVESRVDPDASEAEKLNKSKYKKSHRHVASSESCTVRRPVRNRIKNFDKDFEYDCSYLPKAKCEHKESSLTVLTQKPHLKRKQFLQTEFIEEDIIKSSQETDRLVPKSEPLPPKMHLGTLQRMSAKAASQGKAQMKTKQSTITRRNTPPFARPAYRPSPPIERETSKSASPSSSTPGTEKATAPLAKAIRMKVLLQPSLLSKPYDKLYSESTRPKVGTPRKSSALSPKQYPAAVPKTKRRLNQTSIRKKKTSPQKLPIKLFDPQALTAYSSAEITMLTKSQCKHLDKETDTSGTSLSILPTNSNSSFVNISLQQLKSLQKESGAHSMSPAKSSVVKNISVLKNLEENNEIKISKVSHCGRRDEDDSVRSNKEIIHKSMAKAFKKSLYKKYKKFNLINTDLLPFRNKNIEIVPTAGRSSQSANVYDEEDPSCNAVTISRVESCTSGLNFSNLSHCEPVNIASVESDGAL